MIFRTKPALALEMLADPVPAGVPFRWAGGDCVYGDNPTFVQGVRARGKWYVLDVSSGTQVWTEAPRVIPADQRPRPARGRPPTKPLVVGGRRRVDEIAAALPAGAWRRVVAGEGSQGPRMCEYAEVPVWFCEDELPGPTERLLVRRSLGQEPDIKYHRSNAPAEASLEKSARVRGVRWTIEEDIQSCKGECGLDEYETRGWVGWHHHTALSVLALAFLVLRKQPLREKRTPDDRTRSACAAAAPVGRASLGRGRDPEMVSVATGAQPPRRPQSPQAAPRRTRTAPK
ncbi:hypothetical protein VT84_33585 [Gemmata sp. SH-PL17]|nr:hypothetical protein VT84_33585 [Gemmata sp. SH-PL17]